MTARKPSTPVRKRTNGYGRRLEPTEIKAADLKPGDAYFIGSGLFTVKTVKTGRNGFVDLTGKISTLRLTFSGGSTTVRPYRATLLGSSIVRVMP